MQIEITKHREVTDNATADSKYKQFVVEGTIDGHPVEIYVDPGTSEYDFSPAVVDLAGILEDGEQLQIAIGQYFEDNKVDLGMIGR